MINGLPEKQGLYDPQFEHDACGIGCVANIKGKKSHDIINRGITILKNLAHRGGVGSEPDTGDGAGILIQLPDTRCRADDTEPHPPQFPANVLPDHGNGYP